MTEPKPADTDDWLARLSWGDEDTRIAALRSACPCNGSSRTYEDFMSLLAALKADPSPRVRQVALHLEYDALVHLRQADEDALGYRRNRPGGHGRRGQPRRVIDGEAPWSSPTRRRRYRGDLPERGPT